MNELMLDFETLGNGTNKCICQIGLIYFDFFTGETGKSLKINIDAGSHETYGGKIDAKTVYWWLEQSDAARKSLLDGRTDIYQAMMEVNEFIKDAKRIWSHATFDFVTLMETFKQLKIKPTVSYKAGMDIRTLVHLSGVTIKTLPRDGTHHDALEDCKHQIKYCTLAMNQLRLNKTIVRKIGSIGDLNE